MVTVEATVEQGSRRLQQQQQLQQQQDTHQERRTTISLILLEILEPHLSRRLLGHWVPRRLCSHWLHLCRRRQGYRPLSLSGSRCIDPKATADRMHSTNSISRIITLARSNILPTNRL